MRPWIEMAPAAVVVRVMRHRSEMPLRAAHVGGVVMRTRIEMAPAAAVVWS
jgi:hypothetical protein